MTAPATKTPRPSPAARATPRPTRPTPVRTAPGRAAPVRALAPRAPAPSGFVAEVSADEFADFEQPMGTEFFRTLDKIAAVATPVADGRTPPRTLAEIRGYRERDLFVVAEMATQYLLNGGLRLAVTLFEGLVAVSPSEPYFLLGLGLTYDRMGHPDRARDSYLAAGRADAADPRPELNLAELALERGDRAEACQRLRAAKLKAERADEPGLAQKATLILARLEKGASA